MKDRLRQLMIGRYGVDQLGQFLLWAGVIIMLLSAFFRGNILPTLAVILLIISYFRIFSRNINRRYSENQKFLTLKAKYLKPFYNQKAKRMQKRNYHIYSCPTCKQKIRIPKGKGKICITCPKCHAEFIKKS